MWALKRIYQHDREGSQPQHRRKDYADPFQALSKLATGMHTSLNELFTLVDDMDVDVKMPALSDEDGQASVDMEIISLLAGLSEAKKQQAISFLRFLAADGEK